MNWDDLIIEAAETDTGMRRSNNQDSYCIVRALTSEAFKRHGHVFMVADGMGGHAVGELASKMACENIPHSYKKSRLPTNQEAITKSYQEVCGLIHAKSQANKEFQGMGTTCSTLILNPQGAMIAHVGDSRIYRGRGDQIDQVTHDHSLVWELMRQQHLSLEDAHKAARRKNVITRSLGPEATVDVEIEGPFPAVAGDVFLLCSDGLSGAVEDDELGIFATRFHPSAACRYLLHLANLRGGADNITVIIVRIGSWSDPDAEGRTSGDPTANGQRKGPFLRSLFGSLLRKPVEPTVEENIYRSADCRITPQHLDQLDNLVRQTQALAVEQSWAVDWAAFGEERRGYDESRQHDHSWHALKWLGESIARMGLAGRLYRKGQLSSGAASSSQRS